ncbi:MAG: thymidine kinase [Chitinophagaceae bacterium]|nr:thymidine kinase [Chitinophagaceae bacterium]
MFLETKLKDMGHEKKHAHHYSGWIEIVCGPMFSGKTEELIRRLNRSIIAGQTVKIFKPEIDIRYDEHFIVSHNNRKIESISVKKASEIIPLSEECQVVGIDEAQFFDKEIVSVCSDLANSQKRVIVAGLDMDFLGNPFGQMPILMSISEYVTKIQAICMKCGEVASYSFRFVAKKEKIMLGATDAYQARCRKCFYEDISHEN